MKKICKLLCVGLMLTAGTLTSCTDYQDEIDALDGRVTILENLVSKANSNIDAMQTLINAMADGWIITGMVEIEPGMDYRYPEGYRTISFGKIDPKTGELSTKPEDKKVITIYNGLNGKDGADGQAPDLNLKQDPTDGNYYWTINGEWLLNNAGERIRANGEDGKDGIDGKDGKDGIDGKDGKDGINGKDGIDGKDGKDGKDGIDGKDGKDGKDGVSTAPLLGINEGGMWIVSYDNGVTWELMLDSDGKPISATGKDGKDGKDGENGKDGKDGQNGKDGKDGADGKDGTNGKDAFEFIKSVVINLDAEGNRFVVFELYDGTIVKLPLK